MLMPLLSRPCIFAVRVRLALVGCAVQIGMALGRFVRFFSYYVNEMNTTENLFLNLFKFCGLMTIIITNQVSLVFLKTY